MKKIRATCLLFFILCVPIMYQSTAYAAESSENFWFLDNMDATAAYQKLVDVFKMKDVIVAVVDTGVDTSHSFFEGNLWTNEAELYGTAGVDDDNNGYVDDIHGYDFANDDGEPMDDTVSSAISGHGTHIAGTILRSAGVTESSNPYGVKIMCLKAADQNGNFNYGPTGKAIEYAVANGAKVINMSFGATQASPTLTRAIEAAKDSVIMIAAAGNTVSGGLATLESGYANACNFYPAADPNVVGVMAHDSDNELAYFSNWDYEPYTDVDYEVSAPGVNIYGTVQNNTYKLMSGTSMACGVVSGSAALLCRREMDETGEIAASMPSLTAHLMRTGTEVVEMTDSYGKYHGLHRLNLVSILQNNLRPDLHIEDMKMEGKSLSFFLHNWQADATDITVNLRVAAFGTNAAYTRSYKLDSLKALKTSEEQEISLSTLDMSDEAATIPVSFSITYKNASNASDTTIYTSEFSYSFKGGQEEESGTEPSEIPLTGISLSQSNTIIGVGAMSQILASRIPANTTDTGELSWESSDSSIVSVSNVGTLATLTAKKAGTATIKVSSESGIQATCMVIVVALPATPTETPVQTPSPTQTETPAQTPSPIQIAPTADPKETPSPTPTPVPPTNITQWNISQYSSQSSSQSSSTVIIATGKLITENDSNSSSKLKKPSIKSCKVRKISGKRNKYRVRLKWARNKKAAGYRIYRRTGKGTYRPVKTISSNKVVVFMDSKVKKNKVYTYRVQAIGKGNVKDSAFSKRKKVRVRK